MYVLNAHSITVCVPCIPCLCMHHVSACTMFLHAPGVIWTVFAKYPSKVGGSTGCSAVPESCIVSTLHALHFCCLSACRWSLVCTKLILCHVELKIQFSEIVFIYRHMMIGAFQADTKHTGKSAVRALPFAAKIVCRMTLSGLGRLCWRRKCVHLRSPLMQPLLSSKRA